MTIVLCKCANQQMRGDLSMCRCNGKGMLIKEWTFEFKFGGHKGLALTQDDQGMMEKTYATLWKSMARKMMPSA